MKKQILYMLCATALLSSCHIYKSYDRPEDITASMISPKRAYQIGRTTILTSAKNVKRKKCVVDCSQHQ